MKSAMVPRSVSMERAELSVLRTAIAVNLKPAARDCAASLNVEEVRIALLERFA
jgi:hypothetical protein